MNRLRELREARGLSQRKTAELAGVEPSTINRIEAGSRKISTEQAKRLAEIFGVSMEYLIGAEPRPKNRLRQLREARGITLQQLGEKLGIDYSTLGHIERRRRNFSVDSLNRACAYFGVTADYMLGKEIRTVTFTEHPQNRLKELREAHGLTVRDLAEKIGINHSSVTNMENDARSITVRNLLKLCKFFGVSADYMLGLEGEGGIPLAAMPEEIDDRAIIKAPGTPYFQTNKLGYSMVYMPESPMAGKSGWVFVHRVVMARAIGRDLRPEEVVHHIDGNPRNNARSNLMLFSNNAEHRRYHAQLRRDKTIEDLLNK